MNSNKFSVSVLALCAAAVLLSALNFYQISALSQPEPQANLGGSTSDSFSIGGSLSVTGTSTFTGASGFTGEVGAPIVDKGSVTTLSATSTAQTLTAAQVCDSNIIEWDFRSVSSTLTFPSSSAIIADCLTENGMSITFRFMANATDTTSIATLTANDASLDLVGDGTSDDLINGGNQALITITRRTATTTIVSVAEQPDAD